MELKRVLNMPFLLKKLIDKERRCRLSVKLQDKVLMWSHGFLSEASIIYSQVKKHPDSYISDFSRFVKTPFINGYESILVDDKVIFEKVFSYYVKVPRIIANIDRGNIFSHDKAGESLAVEELLSLHDRLVLKPRRGGGGRGVFVLFKKTLEEWVLNKKNLKLKQLKEIILQLNNYIATEFVLQHGYSESIYPYTTNTLRILTMIDPITKQAFSPIAVQRIGTKSSEPTDNWTRGGLSAEIDMDTGILERAASYPASDSLVWWGHHPDSGKPIRGVKIPRWNEILSRMLEVAQCFWFLPYVGWDVVVTNEGFVVLEGNSNTDVNLLQIHKPLLSDKRVSSFYKYYGII